MTLCPNFFVNKSNPIGVNKVQNFHYSAYCKYKGTLAWADSTFAMSVMKLWTMSLAY